MLYNIDPKLWGKHFWATAHYITISYPNNPSKEEKENVKKFFDLLTVLLPCENCRLHYINNLKITPLTDDILNSKYKLIEWLVNLHNEVNGRTGKKIISVKEAINIYTKPYDNYYTDYFDNIDYVNYTTFSTIFLLIILIFVLIYYAKCCRQ